MKMKNQPNPHIDFEAINQAAAGLAAWYDQAVEILRPLLEAVAVWAQQMYELIEREAAAHGMTVEEYLEWIKEIGRLEAAVMEAERDLYWKRSLLDVRRQFHQRKKGE